MAIQAKVLAGALGCALWSTVFAGTILVPGTGGDIPVSVSSFQDRRFTDVMRQQYDFSCGSAALASLLSFHYDRPVTEQEVFADMLALADQDKVRQQGFSMLDMKLSLIHI